MEYNIEKYGMSINLIDLELPHELIKNDKIKIKISSHPEHNTTIFQVSPEQIKKINQITTINVNVPSTQNAIVIDFRLNRKLTQNISFLFFNKDKSGNDKYIGITYISYKDFTSVKNNNKIDSLSINDKIKVNNIYQTTKDERKSLYKTNKNGSIDNFEISNINFNNHKIIGQMKIQLSLFPNYQYFDATVYSPNSIYQNNICNSVKNFELIKSTKFCFNNKPNMRNFV